MTTPAHQPAIVAFLHARYDEIEQAAKAASGGPWRVGDVVHELGIADVYSAYGRVTSAYSEPCCTIEDAEHIALNDPVSVLADLAAKRRILGLVTDSGPEWHDGYTEAYRDVLRLLALPYADRPGYREEWRP